MEKSFLWVLSCYFRWDCCSVVSLTHPLFHHLIFLLKCIESLALLTHTNWNLTHVYKSFLFPTGAFRGYQTPAKLTGNNFLSPLISPLGLIVFFLCFLQLTDILIFPLVYLSSLHRHLFCSHFHSEPLSCFLNLAHQLLHAPCLFLARQIGEPFNCESMFIWTSIPANVCAYECTVCVCKL